MKSIVETAFRALVALWFSVAAWDAVAAEKTADIHNYVLYYDPVETEAQCEQLGEYDMIVIDPQALGPKAREWIAAWKARGRTVIGYLSCMEVASWHRYRDRVDTTKIITVGGKPFRPFGDNLVMDLTDPGWRKLVVGLIRSEVIDYGCDGVFMDTLADVDHPDLPVPVVDAQLRGLRELLQEIRQAYPGLILISNWTIQKTMPVAAEYVDMIVWENCNPAFFAAGNPASDFMRQVRDAFRREQEKHAFRVLALWAIPEGTPDPEAQRRALAGLAQELGYLSYSCYGDYHCGFLPPDKK